MRLLRPAVSLCGDTPHCVMDRVGSCWAPAVAVEAGRAAAKTARVVGVSRMAGEGMLARRAAGSVGVEAPLVQGFMGGLAVRLSGRVAPPPAAAAERLGRRMPTVVTAGPQ